MPASQINSESKMEALEIEDDLADAVKEAGPNGLSFKDGCDIIGLSYDRFYLLVQQLVSLGRFKIERSQAGNENRIFFPHCAPPIQSAITEKQQEVLDVLCSVMDDERYACISFGEIARRTSCRAPAFVIDRLDVKGFLEVLESGRGAWANLYRVYPNRDGPRGYSWPRPKASANEH
jgi:hypothetical protein